MRIFVFEFVTGGGSLAGQLHPPKAGLLREGNAMWRALVDDLIAADYDVVSTRDARLERVDIAGCSVASIADRRELLPTFQRLAALSDRTIIIAPEIEGWLVRYLELAIEAGAQVLASPLGTITLAADKHATAEYLRATGVPVPMGIALAAGADLPSDFPLPAVLKPRAGAGSEGLRLIASPNDVLPVNSDSRLEEFCPGIAASVSFLCGPNGSISLPPCRQILSDPTSEQDNGLSSAFSYLGGEYPLEPELAIRANALATRAICTLDRPLGYLGVDLVLGSAADGSDDRVIEINPRLTTSYVGLRALSHVNLADAMIRIANGEQVNVAFLRGPLEFFADGRVRFLQQPTMGRTRG